MGLLLLYHRRCSQPYSYDYRTYSEFVGGAFDKIGGAKAQSTLEKAICFSEITK